MYCKRIMDRPDELIKTSDPTTQCLIGKGCIITSVETGWKKRKYTMSNKQHPLN